MAAPAMPTAYRHMPPDLIGRYGIGLDYTGQPVYRAARLDSQRYGDRPLLYNSPYDMNLSDSDASR